ncbi:MAG: YHYH protein, partial [Sphingomonas sp.]|nr:YHYH protein [Sphingomonas sp.]
MRAISRQALVSSAAWLALGVSGCSPGSSTSSGTVAVTPTPSPTPTPTPTPTPAPTPTPTPSSTSTAAVDCPFSGTYTGSYSSAGTLTANWSWTCTSTRRSLTGNGLPNHAVGTFPGTGNPNTISAQVVSTSMTLTPVLASANVTPGMTVIAYARNSVKFDPGTAGTCPGTATVASNCNLANGTDVWRIEALGQSVFDFGVDSNNAHVQPTGVYHYHGMPEGLLTNAGVTAAAPRMLLVGWAADGFPVYARYCYSVANNAASALKVCTGSYVRDTVADSGR